MRKGSTRQRKRRLGENGHIPSHLLTIDERHDGDLYALNCLRYPVKVRESQAVRGTALILAQIQNCTFKSLKSSRKQTSRP